MDTYAPIVAPVEATAEVPPAAPARPSMRSRVAGLDMSRASRLGRKAGPGAALLTAGVVIGAIVGSSWSASAVDGGTSTPTTSTTNTTVPQDRMQGGLGQDLGQDLGQGFGGRRGFGPGGGQMGGQMPGGSTGGFGGFGQQAPSDGTTRAPGGMSSESGSPTELLTF